MLACETFYGRNSYTVCRCVSLGTFWHINNSNLFAIPCAVGVWAIEHDMNLECSVAARSQVDIEHCLVALLCSFKRLDTLCVLC